MKIKAIILFICLIVMSHEADSSLWHDVITSISSKIMGPRTSGDTTTSSTGLKAFIRSIFPKVSSASTNAQHIDSRPSKNYERRHIPEININSQDGNGCTALYLAAVKGNTNTVRGLLNDGADITIPALYSGYTALHAAVFYSNDHTEDVQAMVDYINANKAKNAKLKVDLLDKNNETPLCIAARLGLVAIAWILYSAGADVRHRCKDDDMPIHIATIEGNLAVVDMFYQVDPWLLNMPNPKWFTPLDLARQNTKKDQREVYNFIFYRGGRSWKHFDGK